MPMTMPNALGDGYLSAERSHPMLITMPGAHDYGWDPWTLGGRGHLSEKMLCLMPMTMPMTTPDARDHIGGDSWTLGNRDLYALGGGQLSAKSHT